MFNPLTYFPFVICLCMQHGDNLENIYRNSSEQLQNKTIKHMTDYFYRFKLILFDKYILVLCTCRILMIFFSHSNHLCFQMCECRVRNGNSDARNEIEIIYVHSKLIAAILERERRRRQQGRFSCASRGNPTTSSAGRTDVYTRESHCSRLAALRYL